MYNVIINMYDSIKSCTCISYNNCMSDYSQICTNDHLHNATNDRQNAFPNDHFNFFQRPLSLLHDELTTKMGKLTGNVPQRSHSFSVYTNRCIRLDGLAARCSAQPKLPRQFVPVRNFEPWLFVPMPGNMGRPAFTFINLYLFL